jgi:hypothetical protein
VKITLEMLREKKACGEGMVWVKKNLPKGADYREFIEKLEADGKTQWADWLIGNFEVLVLAGKWRIDSLLKFPKSKRTEKSTDNSAQIGSSRDYAKIGSSGYYAKIGSSGDSAQIGSSGYSAQIGSSGDSAKIEATGKNSVIATAGFNSKAKAGENGCIALAWWDEKAKRPRITVGYVGEDGVEAGKWYELDKKGKLVEAAA